MIEETESETPEYRVTRTRIVGAVIATIILLALSTLLLFPVRNARSDVVAERYLRNSPAIRADAGEITSVSGYDYPSRSQEIARRLQAGESLAGIGEPKDGQSQFHALPTGMTLERLKLAGSKGQIEAEVLLEEHAFGDSGQTVYFVVSEVKFRSEGGNWVNMPVGWTDNYFLLYK